MKQKLVRRLTRRSVLAMAALGLSVFAVSSAHADTVIRIGHFPNITHVQALVAHALSRQGKGWFEQRLGPGVKINGMSTTPGRARWRRCSRNRST